ncbi:hypothetical protein PspCFBP13509_11535 [Pseudomonas sp. CFBP13509]|uniref:hypothetical protein n=1 Tax=Pseudomonas sp. CFBP13509 TaxID=2184008 RepID=UPI0010C132D2|nr:hypothetical protein [Pseudomonas sp. CFBP13509]TKJ79341.1 hypothetical protein PspCFBP13509_11535 [Pseudomonas sp. CFBP13509]
MTDADPLSGIVLPTRVRSHTEKHLARLGRAERAYEVHRALERAEGFVEGLDVCGALNPRTVEALYSLFDGVATVQLEALKDGSDTWQSEL